MVQCSLGLLKVLSMDIEGGWGILVLQQAASITLSEYIKIWCNIQVIIFGLSYRIENIDKDKEESD